MNTLKYLYGLLKSFPALVASFFASMQASNIVVFLSGGYLARAFINYLNGDPGPSFGLGAALALLTIAEMFRVAGMATNMYTSIRVSRFSMALLSLNIMERILKRPGGLPLPLDRKKGRPLSEGQCLNTLSTDTLKIPGMFHFLFEMASMLASGVVAFWIMMSINPAVTLTVYIPLALVFWLINMLRKRVEPLADKARRSAGEVSSLIGDMFNCVQTVKTMGAESLFLGEFRRRNHKRLRDSVRSEFFFTLLRGLNAGLMEFAAGIILLGAAASMTKGAFTVGDFMLFTSYLWAVLGVFRWGGLFLAELKRNDVAIERMETLTSPEPPGTPARRRRLRLDKPFDSSLDLAARPVEPLRSLEVKDLCFTYSAPRQHDDDDPASVAGLDATRGHTGSSGPHAATFSLDRVSFTLEGGSLVAVTGPVGSGKTTLLKCVVGLLPVDSGNVRWNGQETPAASVSARGDYWDAPRAAYTPQVPRLFSDSLGRNILLGLPHDPDLLDRAMRDACLEDDLELMPDGLATQIGPRGVRLSGGQLQRTAAARMFARGARLMVLDDISSALDVETERRLWDRLMAKGGDASYLVATHREAVLRRADAILFLKDGRLEAKGVYSQLMDSCPGFRNMTARCEHPELN
ncbi:MAG: ABC transporter ATP-binding protein [Spirochaetia bacterium]|nr:ABC transporter ATP-binding protein [Spirochaetia bacterium]